MSAFFDLCVPILFLLYVQGCSSHSICNDCDCTISDPNRGEHAILSVKPRCHQGQVTWLNAYGAVKLELLARFPGESRYCIRIDSENINTIVNQEVSQQIPGNYRLKTVDSATVRLSPLITTKGQGQEYCISTSGPVHLYLESERDADDTGVPRVKVHYDIEKSSSDLHYNPMEDCRPCTDRELLRAYCSSDFVVVGTMDDVIHGSDKSAIKVSVDQLISQSEAIFRKSPDGWARPHELKGVVHAPLKCGIRHGEGQFMFTGRVRLGQPVLQCAPRYQQWKHLLEKALANNLLECSYG